MRAIALLREYVETYRETSENEYPVSVLDVPRPLSKHSFVSYLATYGQTRRADHLPSRQVVRGRTTKRVIHHFSTVRRLECLRHDTDAFDAYLYLITINFRAIKQFWFYVNYNNCILEIWASNNNKNNIRKMEIGKKEDGNREEEYEKEAIV